MKPLFDWLRSWRQPKSSKTDECTKPSSSDQYVDMHINTFTLHKGTHVASKSHHCTPIALPAGHHHHHHHHHHHDSRLLKSSRVTPIMTADEDEHKSTTNNDFYDDDDVDLEFSTMMMASFATITRPCSHRTLADTHFTSTTTFSPKRASMPYSMSMPKAHSASPRSPAPNMHVPPRHSVEGPPMPHSSSQESPKVHPLSTPAKKSSRMPRSPLLRVLGRPPLPDSPSARPLEQLPILRSPSTHVTSRRSPRSPLSSTARAKDHPSIPQSPSTRTKGSSKTPPSPSIRAMANPTTAPHSPSTRAMERQAHPPSSSKARKSAHGASTSPSIHPSSGGSNAPLAAKEVNIISARTYQPLCCSSGTCILECHAADTSKKADQEAAAQIRKPQAKSKPTKYRMTILPSKDGARGGRRLSFKNGRWITDDSDYVVLELK